MESALEVLNRRISDWQTRVADVTPSTRLPDDQLKKRVAVYDFASAHDLQDLVADVADLLEAGTLHSTHPRYFGLFNPGVRSAGVIADALAALYNPQLAAHWHAPAACEIESQVLRYFLCRIGFDSTEASATFTTGGAEANLTGVLAALSDAFPHYSEGGLAGLERRPVLYASDQVHDSFVKIARITGLGGEALRRLPADDQQRFKVMDLRRAIDHDRASGYSPFLVIGTVGTTATGAIDPLAELAALCGEEGLWLHADAAWGGLALLSDNLRKHVASLALADSITWDAHKVLPVPMGAGMFFCRSKSCAESIFSVRPGYVPASSPGSTDAYQRTVQWSRRFIGLKVFMTIAEVGAAGVAALVDHQAEMADLLRDELTANGWRVTNDSPLPLVCFTRSDMPKNGTAAIADSVAAEGDAWISEVRLPSGDSWLRACITHYQTDAADIHRLVVAVNRAFASLHLDSY